MKEGKMESYLRINSGNGRVGLLEDGVQRIWKDYFENPCNIDI